MPLSPGTRRSRIDVIIVTFRSAGEIGACVTSVRSCSRAGRVIVVDNHSDDESVAAARSAGADIVIESPANVGFARAVNLALRESASPLVLLLNPDARLTDSSLAALAISLEDDEAAFSGPLLQTPTGPVCGARRFSTVLNRLLWHLPWPGRPFWSTPEYRPGETSLSRPIAPVDYLWGAVLLCRRSFLDTIGGLDERFFLYSEDEDLGRQAARLGFHSVLVTTASVWHLGGASTDDEPLAQARIERSTLLLLEKWHGRAAAVLFGMGLPPVLVLRALLLTLAGRPAGARLAWRTVRLFLSTVVSSAGDHPPTPGGRA